MNATNGASSGGNQTNAGNENGNANGMDSVNDMENESGGGNRLVSLKTLAEGLFDLSLLSSNANQLVHLLNNPMTSGNPGFRRAAIALLIISIILQVIVGGLLVALIAVERRRTASDRQSSPRRILNSTVTVLIFFITILNVLIPSFHPTAEQQSQCGNQAEMLSSTSDRSWSKKDYHY